MVTLRLSRVLSAFSGSKSTMVEEQKVICYRAWGSCIPARYILAVLGFLGISLQYTLKVNLSVAIVAMVGIRETLDDYINGTCPQKGITPNITEERGEFDWSEEDQGLLLSSYYYGYLATQLLGGYLAQRFGGRLVFGPGVFLTGVLCLFTPVMARCSFAGLMALRALEGAASGVVIPSMHSLFSLWYPPQERQGFSGFIFPSIYFGSLMGMGLSGLLIEWGWPAIFYVEGAIAVVWFVLWMALAYDTPQSHPYISDEEKRYILESLGEDLEQKKTPKTIPWTKIILCPPIWAGILMQTGWAWILFFLLNELPTYLGNILHYNVRNSGVISSLPYLFAWVTGIFSAALSQWMRSRGYLSHINAYRFFNGLVTLGGAGGFLVITFAGCDATTIIVMFVLVMFSNGLLYGGSYLNHVDLASNHAGTIAGILHTFVNSPGLITPLVTAAIIDGEQTKEKWQSAFYLAIGIIVGVYIIYLMFGSVTERPWNKWGMEEDKEENGEMKGREDDKQISTIHILDNYRR